MQKAICIGFVLLLLTLGLNEQLKAQCDDIDFGCSNFNIIVDLAVDTAGLLSLCEGEPISFINQTTSNLNAIDSFVWIFNYLNAESVPQDCEITPSLDPVTHVYHFDDSLICTNPSQDFFRLSVGLSAIDTNGCFSLVQSNEIIINILPRAYFTANTTICTNGGVNINNLSCPNSANIEFEWESQPDGQTSDQFNPGFTYPDPGTYTITLTAISDTCHFEDTYTQQITVLDPPEPAYVIGTANTDSLCAELDTLVLIDQSMFADSTYWQITPGSNVTYVNGVRGGDTVLVVFQSSGTYHLTLNSSNQACTRDTSFSIEVEQVALLNVNNLPDCIDTNVVDLSQYTNFNGIPDSYVITVTYLEDGSQQVFSNTIPTNLILPGYGNYEVEIISTSECGAITRKGLFGNYPHITVAPIEDLCANQDTVINLNNLVLPTSNICLEWVGTGVFNDSLFNPSLVGEGDYTVRLRDCDRICINIPLDITVLGSAINFEPITICITDGPIALDDIQSGQWYGTGVVNDSLFPSLIGIGIFDIYYLSDTSAYCEIRDTLSIEIKDSVMVDFAVNSPNCLDSVFRFVNLSSDSVVIWDFGDGITSMDEDPQHQYGATGSYTVKLVAGDPLNGCVDSSFQTVIVQLGPSSSFNYTIDSVKCDSADLTFMAVVQDSNTNYIWTINGDTAYGELVNYTIEVFDTASQILVTLTASNSCGAAVSNQIVNLPSGFYVDLLYDSEAIKCAGDTVDFILVGNNIDSFIIDYGNGIVVVNEVIDIPFPNSSDTIIDYEVTIYAFNAICGWDTAQAVIPVQRDVPVAAALYSDDHICQGETILFYNVSQYESETVIFFGDGNSGIFTNDTIAFQYTNAGEFTPLVVAYGCGIDSNFLDPITVAPLPMFDIEVVPVMPCIGEEITMINNGNGIAPVWLIDGDTVASFVDTFYFEPPSSGEYEIILVATAPGNSFCSTTDTVNISVGQQVGLSVEVSPVSGCAPLSVNVSATSADPTTNYYIDFGNQQVSQNSNATAIYSSEGWYNLSISGTNDGGCREDTIIQIEVLDAFLVQALGDTTIRIGAAVELDFEVNQNFESFSWYNADTLIGTNTVRPLILYPEMDAVYGLVVFGLDSSCYDTDTVLVFIECDDLFLPDAFSPNNDGFNDRFNVFKVFGDYEANNGKSCLQLIDVSIFDRWGELIYFSEDESAFWDGTYKGKALNAGIFTVVVNYRKAGKTETIKKEIHLIK
ncbi:MAG: PKD domain-containing protein [Chitinophagales bacterium]